MASNENFLDRFVTSMSLRSILFKFTLGFILVGSLALHKFREFGDMFFSQGGSFISLGFITQVLYPTYKTAVGIALANIYPLTVDIMSGAFQFFQASAWISIGYAGFLFLALIFQYHNIIGFFLHLFLPDSSDIMITWLAILFTSLIILLLSWQFHGSIDINPLIESFNQTGLGNVTPEIEALNNTLGIPTINLN